MCETDSASATIYLVKTQILGASTLLSSQNPLSLNPKSHLMNKHEDTLAIRESMVDSVHYFFQLGEQKINQSILTIQNQGGSKENFNQQRKPKLTVHLKINLPTYFVLFFEHKNLCYVRGNKIHYCFPNLFVVKSEKHRSKASP